MLDIPEKKRKILEKKGIQSDVDLSYVVPYKYYDFTHVSDVCLENVGRYIAVRGLLERVQKKSGNGRSVITCKVKTPDTVLTVTFIGQVFMEKILESMLTEDIIVCGKLQYSDRFKMFSMLNPLQFTEHASALKWMKIYPKYTGIGGEWLETTVKAALSFEALPETFPEYVLKETKLPGRKEALKHLHYPIDRKKIQKSIQRQIFEDLLYFACSLERNSAKVSKGSPFNLKVAKSVNKICNSLPYELTNDQTKVLKDIFDKMIDGKRINALIQGDVGCGKSIVSFLLMLAMADSGYQSVIMAPTVVLAEQHYNELSGYANQCGYKVAFLGGKQSAKEKREILVGIQNGDYQLVVGTHAVISAKVTYKNLALTVVDEEHRFGVRQREALAEKAKNGVHTISFSATPIPRSVASSIYGDTDIYEIKTMPKGRSPIKTAIVEKEEPTIAFVKKELAKGNQAYVVCPLIDGVSEKKTVEEVQKMYIEELGIAPGVVTGKQKADETEKVLRDFKDGKIKVLIATTVIEVGVNVPNATVIVIEDAWMFGLAQLHQLRGRVGRGNKQGYCILRSDKDVERLHAMCETTDGFKIAEYDLNQRGAGNLIGEEQSGNNRYLENALRFPEMFKIARSYAKKMVLSGEDEILIEENKFRSDKIYIKPEKMKIYV